MNLRITEQHLQFKITAPELRTLLAGNPLEQQVRLGTSVLCVGIDPDTDAEGLSPVYDPKAPAIRLPVAPSLLHELEALGRDRNGLSQQNGDTLTVLQVDVRREKAGH